VREREVRRILENLGLGHRQASKETSVRGLSSKWRKLQSREMSQPRGESVEPASTPSGSTTSS
jgi:hypothetical protein